MITGSHRIDIIDRSMMMIKDYGKLPENDKTIILEGNILIGARAIMLKSVTIGKGAMVDAGSIVTKDVAEYSVVAGNPARVIKMRSKKVKCNS